MTRVDFSKVGVVGFGWVGFWIGGRQWVVGGESGFGCWMSGFEFWVRVAGQGGVGFKSGRQGGFGSQGASMEYVLVSGWAFRIFGILGFQVFRIFDLGIGLGYRWLGGRAR